MARRLEGFGDVVFGFSIAQLALQLDLPRTPGDLYGHPIRYVLYFATFALLALLWLAYHRMLAGAYRPTRVDLTVTFIYLAFVGLIPYAMYANAHFATVSTEAARDGFATYLICAIGTSTAAAVVLYRNLLRGWEPATPQVRLRQWRGIVAFACVAAVMTLALIVDVTVGVIAGGPVTALAGLVGPIVRWIPLPRLRPAGTNPLADVS